ncbi:MAG: hypothetical protein ACYTEL_23225 [Planctomycetota bacterium]|jgi:hypothetical protein
MERETESLQDELRDLREELEHFQEEKERVREIIGKIGGVPQFHTRIINVIFVTIIVASVVLSIFAEKLRILMIEVATITLSAKIIYLIHCQMKINHFQFWILSSLEWRLNEIMRIIRRLEKE